MTAIAHLITQNKPVAIADVAFANGGETELIQMLDDNGVWDDVVAYGGWNTSCNTLGTAIATGILSLGSHNLQGIQAGKIYRLLEDWGYQSIVRSKIIDTYLPTISASYYDFGDQENKICHTAKQQLLQCWENTFRHSFSGVSLQIADLSFPWHRMFEINLNLTTNQR